MTPSTRRIEQLAGLCSAADRRRLLRHLTALFRSPALGDEFSPSRRGPRFGGWSAFWAAERRLPQLLTILLGIALLVPIVLLGTSLADNFARFAGEMLSVFEKGLPPPPPWVAELPYVGSTLSDAWLYFATTARSRIPRVSM